MSVEPIVGILEENKITTLSRPSTMENVRNVECQPDENETVKPETVKLKSSETVEGVSANCEQDKGVGSNGVIERVCCGNNEDTDVPGEEECAQRRGVKRSHENDVVDVENNKKIRIDYPDLMIDNPELKKFWRRRYKLFSKYDKGIRLDDKESWYSVTPEHIAKVIAERCRCDLVVDAFCGAGGNTIQLAFTCKRVIAIDIDPHKIEMARNNARVYGVEDKIEFITGDFLQMAPTLKADVVFLSPPWGGMDYTRRSEFPLADLLPVGGRELYRIAAGITKNVAIYLPKIIIRQEVMECAESAGAQVQLVPNFHNRRLRAITAYFGELVNRAGPRNMRLHGVTPGRGLCTGSVVAAQQQHRGAVAARQQRRGAVAARKQRRGAVAARQQHRGAGAEQQQHRGAVAARQQRRGAMAARQQRRGAVAARQQHRGAVAARQQHRGAVAAQQQHRGAVVARQQHRGAVVARQQHRGAVAARQQRRGAVAARQQRLDAVAARQQHRGVVAARQQHRGTVAARQQHRGALAARQKHRGAVAAQQQHLGAVKARQQGGGRRRRGGHKRHGGQQQR